jgi:hypothetical protein
VEKEFTGELSIDQVADERFGQASRKKSCPQGINSWPMLRADVGGGMIAS